MATFKINGNMTIEKLKIKFKNKFGGCLSVKDTSYHIMKDSVILSSIGVNNSDISYDSSTSIETFQEKVFEKCKLHIAIRTPDDWVEVPNPIKLDMVKNLPKNATINSLYLFFLKKITSSVNKLPVEVSTSTKGKGLPTRYMPTCNEVKKWNEKWQKPRKMSDYMAQERILVDLFKRYPNNVKYEDVLLKVLVLNEFYSTGIINPRYVAERLCELAVDKKLKSKSLDLVNKIADVTINKNTTRNFFSFATKYCSFHRPDVYPIYDSYVCEVLKALRTRDGFCSFKNADLRNAEKFKYVIDEFRKVYNLVDNKGQYVDYKTLDRYLWLLGKEYFK